MPIRIERGRQFQPSQDAAVPLFERSGKLGGWLPAAGETLAAAGVVVQLERVLARSDPRQLTLSTPAEWNAFLSEHVRSKDDLPSFARKFGVSFQDFVEVVDDLARGGEGGFAVDLSPRSEFARALSLDKVENDYGAKLQAGARLALGGGVEAEVAPRAIGPEVLTQPINDGWQRDRTEQESWADFVVRRGANRLFRDNTGPEPFLKLSSPTWADDEAMAVAGKFALPVHLEERRDSGGAVSYQDKDEMFRETYFDDRHGTLGKTSASVRARVRFDDKPPHEVRRVLVQAKEGRSVDEDTGRSAVRKFEKRWENDSVTEAEAQERLVSGKDGAGPLAVSQKLYQLAHEAGTLPKDGQLRLEPKTIVLQKRRRTHLHLDSLVTVTKRRDEVKAEVEAQRQAGTVDPRAEAWLVKLDAQVDTLTSARDLLRKYGQSAPSGECFIVSQDRYAVYDPTARIGMPNDLDDEAGVIGEGLHVEAEWDSANSDPYEKALAQIAKRQEAGEGDAAELAADADAIEALRELFRADVEQVVALLRDRLTGAGLELDPAMKSKEERATDFLSRSDKRAIHWI